MILTYKIKHDRDFSDELRKAKLIAEFAINNRNRLSSKNVKHIGLKSVISNQILRKYGRNKGCKKIHRVNLILPSQGIKVDTPRKMINIPSLRFEVPYEFETRFEKINQIEINRQFVFVSVTVNEEKEYKPSSWIGVDLNTTGHCCVASNTSTGKVLKLGKKANHTHQKYKNIRRKLQKKKRFSRLKKIRRRESKIVKDLNHKMSRKIVNDAVQNNSGIVMEDLSGIRKANTNKNFRYALNSWSFYQLRTMIEYKAKLLGVPVIKIDPQYTSQQCSKCGLLGTRNKKLFKCSCGHVEDADVNASFVIGLRHQGVLRSIVDRDTIEGNTDIPKRAIPKRTGTLEPAMF